jgi:hypothetical protein
MKKIIVFLFVVTSGFTLSLRPHIGLGTDETQHYGVRVLLGANDLQLYGLDVTKFSTKDDKFTSVGIVLEQRVWEWFNMSIGTIGYFDYKGQNQAGLMTNLGWEPNRNGRIEPFVTYRSDTIFTKDKTDTIHSLSVGVKYNF